jgi:predicted phage terminase large subunit-like protein
MNEVSQISLSARTILMTRLAQNCGLALKTYSDCNPPMATHWAHRLFIEKRDPSPPYAPLADPDAYAWLTMNPKDNLANLSGDYIAELERLPAREKLRFLEGKWGSAGENVLFTYELIEQHRQGEHPDLQRIVVGVDPSGASGPEDKRSDSIGIIVAGLGIDGRAYILEDASCRAAPHVWGKIVAQAYTRHDADAAIVEKNFGGAMAKDIIEAAASQNQTRIFIKEVTATRGKVVRAEPIAQLYEQGKVSHIGRFDQLEDEMTAYTTAGYMGDRSPDRADALIWALSELFPRVLQHERNGRWQRPEPVTSSRTWSSRDRGGRQTDWQRPEPVTRSRGARPQR